MSDLQLAGNPKALMDIIEKMGWELGQHDMWKAEALMQAAEEIVVLWNDTNEGLTRLIDGAAEHPYINDHGYKVREVCECDFQRLLTPTPAASAKEKCNE